MCSLASQGPELMNYSVLDRINVGACALHCFPVNHLFSCPGGVILGSIMVFWFFTKSNWTQMPGIHSMRTCRAMAQKPATHRLGVEGGFYRGSYLLMKMRVPEWGRNREPNMWASGPGIAGSSDIQAPRRKAQMPRAKGHRVFSSLE